MKTRLFVAAALLFLASPVWAAPKTVTLSVPGMTCAACPITVKKALTKVAGVSKVEVSFKTREAVVTFDDARTSVDALTKATKDAGYPSTVKGKGGSGSRPPDAAWRDRGAPHGVQADRIRSLNRAFRSSLQTEAR